MRFSGYGGADVEKEAHKHTHFKINYLTDNDDEKVYSHFQFTNVFELKFDRDENKNTRNSQWEKM